MDKASASGAEDASSILAKSTRKIFWADSSIGRALHSHCRGWEFESPSVHLLCLTRFSI